MSDPTRTPEFQITAHFLQIWQSKPRGERQRLLRILEQFPDSLACPDTDKPEPRIEPLLIGRKQAAAACGVALRTWDRMNGAGKIGPRPIRLSGRLLWNVEELRAWAAAGVGGNLPDRTEWQTRKRPPRHEGTTCELSPTPDPLRGPRDGAPGGHEEGKRQEA